MRFIVNTARFLVGILFIFSGLVKANDPLGLSYKMQEFFDVWARNESLSSIMYWLDSYALPFSIIIITLEIIVGVGILLGLWKNLFSWLLLLLIIFFSFLTGYAVFSGKIATCGCFGDCIPLTALQSFIKDLILFALILIIFFGVRYIKPVLNSVVNFFLVIISVVVVLGFQWFVLRHLPVVDCLPYKKGKDILESRKMPANAIPDKKGFKFFYTKGGKEQEFSARNLPDSTWEFVRRDDFIIEKGSNNEPPVKDFYLTTNSGSDSTEAVLTTNGAYYLFFLKDLSNGAGYWQNNFESIYKQAKSKNIPIFVIASQTTEANSFFNVKNSYNLPVLSLDATALKTAARTNPELYLMNGPVVENKWGWADFGKAVEKN